MKDKYLIDKLMAKLVVFLSGATLAILFGNAILKYIGAI